MVDARRQPSIVDTELQLMAAPQDRHRVHDVDLRGRRGCHSTRAQVEREALEKGAKERAVGRSHGREQHRGRRWNPPAEVVNLGQRPAGDPADVHAKVVHHRLAEDARRTERQGPRIHLCPGHAAQAGIQSPARRGARGPLVVAAEQRPPRIEAMVDAQAPGVEARRLRVDASEFGRAIAKVLPGRQGKRAQQLTRWSHGGVARCLRRHGAQRRLRKIQAQTLVRREQERAVATNRST